MKEEYGMERSRISKFVIEPINDKFSEKGGEISPGPLSSLLLRNKYEGIKIQVPVIADSVIWEYYVFKLLSKMLRILIANIIDCTIQNLRLWKPYPAYDKIFFDPSNELWAEKIDPATKEITWEPNVEPSSKSFIKYDKPVSTNPSSGFFAILIGLSQFT